MLDLHPFAIGMLAAMAAALLVCLFVLAPWVMVGVACVAAAGGLAPPLKSWALKGTVSRRDLAARQDAAAEAWLMSTPPPIPFKASWEDDSLFAEPPQNPRIAEVTAARDADLAAERWDAAIAKTEQIIRMLDNQAAPKVAPRPRDRSAARALMDAKQGAGGAAKDESDEYAERRRRDELALARGRQARAAAGARDRRLAKQRAMPHRYGPRDWESTEDGYVRVYGGDGRELTIDPQTIRAIQVARDGKVRICLLDGTDQVYLCEHPERMRMRAEFENQATPSKVMIFDKGVRLEQVRDKIADLQERENQATPSKVMILDKGVRLEQVRDKIADLQERASDAIEALNTKIVPTPEDIAYTQGYLQITNQHMRSLIAERDALTGLADPRDGLELERG